MITFPFRNPFKKVREVIQQKAEDKRYPNIEPELRPLCKGECPDCGGRNFFMGPSGGMGQNIKCANEKCNSEFNCAPFDDGWCGTPFLIERIKR